MKPIIGIVSRPGITKNDSLVHSVEESYKNAVIRFGGIPIVILPQQDVIFHTTKTEDMSKMNDEEIDSLNRILSLCDGFIIPGGYRVYEYDYYVCKYAKDNNIPILGICAGMQTMCSIDNPECTNILIEEENHFKEDDSTHSIDVIKNTLLYEILNTNKIEVNSYHRYKVSDSGIYKVSANSDNCIEAIEYPENNFYLGVQWHPEKTIETDINSKKIFIKFINSTQKK